MKKYDGYYVDGKKHGYGIFTSENGSRYEGNWENGKQHGIGRQFNANGELVKEGTWTNGRKDND